MFNFRKRKKQEQAEAFQLPPELPEGLMSWQGQPEPEQLERTVAEPLNTPAAQPESWSPPAAQAETWNTPGTEAELPHKEPEQPEPPQPEVPPYFPPLAGIPASIPSPKDYPRPLAGYQVPQEEPQPDPDPWAPAGQEDGFVRVDRFPEFKLEWEVGVFAGQKIAVHGVMMLGVEPVCDLQLPLGTPGISRKHLRVWEDSGAFYAMDLKSTYGSQLNGEPMKPGLVYPVKRGDTLTLGKEKIRVG